ncbi:unnamed protein product [Rangifer tarandus platyrhynchus]|uniref:Uncharacterized protein n=1 Tax=Rangifer tarandus platyrhynchus TaxID=3082113 RepID=A0AC59ZR09_RANTA
MTPERLGPEPSGVQSDPPGGSGDRSGGLVSQLEITEFTWAGWKRGDLCQGGRQLTELWSGLEKWILSHRSDLT